MFGCDFCSVSFESNPQRKEHLFSHFKSRKCNDCGKMLLMIDGEWYARHNSDCIRNAASISNPLASHIEQTFIKEEPIEFPAFEHVETNELSTIDSYLMVEIDECPTKFENPYNDNIIFDEAIANHTKKNSKSDTKRKSSAKNSKKTDHQPVKPSQRNDRTVKIENNPMEMQPTWYSNTSTKILTSDLRPIGRLLCDICGKSSKSFDAMRKHMALYHMKKRTNIPPRANTELRPPPPYECDYCHITLVTFDGLRQHLKRHISKVDTHVECTVCKKRLLTESSLKVHMRRHTGELPYMCHMCGKSFNHPHHLK